MSTPTKNLTSSTAHLLAYGSFALPLALLALPIYMYIPKLYAENWGLSLSLIGGILLITRLLDALIDPVLGNWIDRSQHQHHRRTYRFFILCSIPLLLFGFTFLFHPDLLSSQFLLLTFIISLMTVYIGFSLATISYQSWGSQLAQSLPGRTRISASREAFTLIGIILASIIPHYLGFASLPLFFALLLGICATLLIYFTPLEAPQTSLDTEKLKHALQRMFKNRRFVYLLSIFTINGIASAIPATLFLFFVDDHLQLGAYSGLLLLAYFAFASFFIPLWVKLSQQIGEAKSWQIGMIIALCSFTWTFFLPSGSLIGFTLVCIFSGIALGADLVIAPALLTAVIAQKNEISNSASYFGIWNFVSKLNLALAAGITLPLLQYFGYEPHLLSQNLSALTIIYTIVPCALKAIALYLLIKSPLKHLHE